MRNADMLFDWFTIWELTERVQLWSNPWRSYILQEGPSQDELTFRESKHLSRVTTESRLTLWSVKFTDSLDLCTKDFGYEELPCDSTIVKGACSGKEHVILDPLLAHERLFKTAYVMFLTLQTTVYPACLMLQGFLPSFNVPVTCQERFDLEQRVGRSSPSAGPLATCAGEDH